MSYDWSSPRAVRYPLSSEKGYVRNVPAVFRSADVFAFPTLEEGSALVVYEAMASGLPGLYSPMGAGMVARHEQDGYVMDPYDEEAWVAALRRLAGDRELRQRLGKSAQERAQEFTWPKVGRQRSELWLKAFAKSV